MPIQGRLRLRVNELATELDTHSHGAAEPDTHPAVTALPVLLFVAPAQAGVPSIARLMGSENKNIQYNQ